MQRKLTLDGTDQPLYHLLQEGLYAGSVVERQEIAKKQGQQSRQDRASELRVRRAIEAMGTPPPSSGDKPAADPSNPYATFDGRVRKLPESGATLVLDQADFARLVRYIGQVNWPIQVVDASTELEDRLEAAPEVKDDAKS
jgi:hypothetical protein